MNNVIFGVKIKIFGERIKQTLKENNNCVLIASYGCVGTGITLSNLCYGVLFESFKSDVINMQSLGRGLGLSKLKDKYIVYDFIDDMGYAVKAFKTRCRHYKKAGAYICNEHTE